MADTPRVLVTAALGQIIVPVVQDALPGALVAVATDDDELRRSCDLRPRFDVVLTDLIWYDANHEFRFDGLDVLATLRELGRTAPVIVAAHGYGRELDHLEEVIHQPEVVGVIQKADGPSPVVNALRIAIRGQRLSLNQSAPGPARSHSIYSYFESGRRGATAGRMAGAIAAGRASNSQSLHEATNIPLNTVNKLTSYFATLIRQRGEHDPALPLTAPTVYRWVGEHAHYILSWCRRHGHADVARPYERSGH